MGSKVLERRGEGGGPGRIVGAIEQDLPALDLEQLQSTGPDRRCVPGPTGVRSDAGDPGRFEGIEQGIGDGHVGGLVPAPQAHPGASEARQFDLDAVPIPAQEWGRPDLPEWRVHAACPAADDREGIAGRARDRQIAALDDRGLLAGDVRDGRAQVDRCGQGPRS